MKGDTSPDAVFLPISLDITGKNILIIGGGRIAYHKIKLLMVFTRNITVVAPEILDEIRHLGLPCINQTYGVDLLDNAFLVYTCTNYKELNATIKADCKVQKILCNVVDDPANCDFVSPAIIKKGNMTVAVGSNAQDVYQSIRWRDAIKDYIEKNGEFTNG